AYADRTFPLFVELHAMREMTFNKITQPNRNGLLAAYPGADGVKTGMTSQAGYSLVASAGREGMRLVAVILKAESAAVREAEATKLLNYGFRNFETVKVLSKGDDLGEVQVRSGKEETVGLVAEETLVATIPRGKAKDIERKLDASKSLEAPVEKGAKVGTVSLVLDAQEIGKSPVLTAAAVERASLLARLVRAVSRFFVSLIRRVTE
ncbi:MAG: D-alanyl-D-alanine carboxypeptidase, partial [Firmicutes bacterium]|nr:D-alanyl-D-alanine carboxypeptidase [Bacillota bacterium]